MNKQRKSTMVKMLGQEVGHTVWALNKLAVEMPPEVIEPIIHTVLAEFGWDCDWRGKWTEDYYSALYRHYNSLDAWKAGRDEKGKEKWLEKVFQLFPIALPAGLVEKAWENADQEKYWPPAPLFFLHSIELEGSTLSVTKTLVTL